MKQQKKSRTRGPKAKSQIVQFRVPQVVIEALKEPAENLNVSVNEAARTLLEHTLFPITLQLELEQIRDELNDPEASVEKLAHVLAKASNHLQHLVDQGEWFNSKIPLIMDYKNKFDKAEQQIRETISNSRHASELEKPLEEFDTKMKSWLSST